MQNKFVSTNRKWRLAKVPSMEGVAQAALAMRNRNDTTDVLRNSKVPILFIIGKEDKAIDPLRSIELTHLPKISVISILEGVGHMGMIEKMNHTQREVKEFLDLLK